MTQKTIVMIGNMSWGMFQFRADLMKEFLSQGYKVVVIAPKDEWSARIEAIGCEFVDIEVSRKGTNPLKDLIYLQKLTLALLRFKPYAVINYTIKPVIYGSIASWLVGAPNRIAVTTGLGYTFSHDNWIGLISRLLYRVGLKFASQVWFLNSEDLKTFLDNNLVNAAKTFLLPSEGVDVEHYSPIGIKKDQVTFTLVSRMLWDKGVGFFAECAKELKKNNSNIQFLIVGPVDEGNPEGIPLSKLQEWHNSGYITYLGAKNDVREVLRQTSCLVHPTYYKEGVPRILMEAQAMGVPCITTDIAGCRDVIKHGQNGFLIKPKDLSSLKDTLLAFLKLDEGEIEKMSLRAREHVILNFASERINSIYTERLVL